MINIGREIRNLFEFRRLPVKGRSLVLDVGSGDNPHVRADVLCDAHLESGVERRGKFDLIVDGRPFIFADSVNLPFKDKAFDFVICRHLLEHMYDPLLLLAELERIGKAGYIETPSSLLEKLHGWDFHRLLVDAKNNCLDIRAKPKDEKFGLLPQEITKSPHWGKFVDKNSGKLLSSCFWKDKIEYRLEGVFEKNITEKQEKFTSLPVRSLRRRARWGLTKIFRLFVARPKFRINEILACPKCHKGLKVMADHTFCSFCNMPYPILEKSFFKFR
jgi:SAM-dependent methyltransferase